MWEVCIAWVCHSTLPGPYKPLSVKHNTRWVFPIHDDASTPALYHLCFWSFSHLQEHFTTIILPVASVPKITKHHHHQPPPFRRHMVTVK